MIQNHLFWLAVALFFLSTVNLRVFFEYRYKMKVLPLIIGAVGIFGMVGGFVRLISLSTIYNWWWFIGVAGASLIIIGMFAHFSRIKIRLFVGAANIALIPLVWWLGSRLNYTYTCDWFYDALDAVHNFFY